jgi:hypothetical protein
VQVSLQVLRKVTSRALMMKSPPSTFAYLTHLRYSESHSGNNRGETWAILGPLRLWKNNLLYLLRDCANQRQGYPNDGELLTRRWPHSGLISRIMAASLVRK